MRLRESRWLEVESQLPTMAFERARMESAKELDLEKELSKVNQEHGGEPLVLNEEPKIGDVKRRQEAVNDKVFSWMETAAIAGVVARDGRGSYFFHGAGQGGARPKIYGAERTPLRKVLKE